MKKSISNIWIYLNVWTKSFLEYLWGDSNDIVITMIWYDISDSYDIVLYSSVTEIEMIESAY